MKYDKIRLSLRLKELRNNRWKLYVENNYKNTIYDKYKCCKTQSSMAEKLEVDQRTYGGWERGENLPTLDTLLILCDLLDCQLEYFVNPDETAHISSVVEASYFSHIHRDIINEAFTNPIFADNLNFFMQPHRCLKLFNKIELLQLKALWINQKTLLLAEPLLCKVEMAFDYFYNNSSSGSLTLNNYKKALKSHIPKEMLNFENNSNTDNRLIVADCVPENIFDKIMEEKIVNRKYAIFINYIGELTFIALLQKPLYEIQRKKLADEFLSLLDEYIRDA